MTVIQLRRAIPRLTQVIRTVRHTGGYSNFGHKIVHKPRIQVAWELSVVGALLYSIYYYFRHFSALSDNDAIPGNLRAINDRADHSGGPTEEDEDLDDGFEDADQIMQPIDEKRRAVTFRDNKVNAYENRIRKFSNPDKVFRYFSTIRTTKDCSLPDTILMTPSDFIRAITFDRRQPVGLELDRFRRLNPDIEDWHCQQNSEMFPPSSVLKRIPPWDGLLTYNDFLIFLVLISIPQTHLKYVFRMMDVNDNGLFDVHEFNEIRRNLVGTTTGPSNIERVFFGPDGKGFLTSTSFLTFCRQLRDELCWIEFHRVSGEGCDTIDPSQFCQLVLAYVQKDEVKQLIKERMRLSHLKDVKITYSEYLDFVHFVEALPEIKYFTEIYKFGLDLQTLRALVKNAFGIHLSDSVLKIIFAVFDKDSDGKLNQAEFFSVLRAIQTKGVYVGNKLVYKNGVERLVGLGKSCTLCSLEVLADRLRRLWVYRGE